ncbi:ribonuclease VapC [Stella humosa]|uniref:Ribonuclease VapC n=1 Tax=Stella humosa TaxID=94 RepID=A0A3N1M862_9PROT|nr:type II toxin-antitoxin system VapC family toxin [Stella humosa]ROP99902.1 ribonuclease VapC [Stella humosa]BBK30868.1 ribonuclease VapC [Stella humosa]
MIAVDTSALMAIVLNESPAAHFAALLEAEVDLLISAGTLSEALIVADRRNVGEEMTRLIDGLGFTVVSLTAASAKRIAQAYAAWGKGVHPAGLNLGDCFAYVVAKDHGCSLLYVGEDFALTDVERAD